MYKAYRFAHKMSKPLHGKEAYEEFNARQYLETFYNSPISPPEHGDFQETRINHFHQVFNKWSIHGDRLIDLASGPSLLQVMSASAHFPHITLAEYVEVNRKELRKWIDHDPDGYDWTPFFKHVADMEGDESKWQEVEARLRSSIKEVVTCDILQPHPLAPLSPDPYDCVISSLTLESACTDITSLKASVKALVSLLKPGGKLILSGVTGFSTYEFGDGNIYHSLNIDKSDLEEATREAGCDVLSWEGKGMEATPENLKKELYMLVAEKKEA